MAAAEAEAEAEEADALEDEADDEEADDEEADEDEADESLAEDSLEEAIEAELELSPEEPGFSANMARATMAAKTAMAAIMNTTIPPPPRLGVGSKLFPLRIVALPVAVFTVGACAALF